MELKANNAAFGIFTKHKKPVLAVCVAAILIVIALVGLHLWDQKVKSDQAKAYLSGHNAYSKGQFDRAIKSLEEAKKLNPNDAKTHTNLAQSYEAKGRLDKAAGEYEASLKVNPNQPEACYNLAIIYKSQGKLDKAVEGLSQAVKLNGNFVAARIALGDLYAQKGDNTKAKEQYQKVIDMKPFGVDLEAIKGKLSNLK